VALSPSRFSHLFTEQVGIPPARFVELRRIERAQALLASSSLPIGAIAEVAGFKQPVPLRHQVQGARGDEPEPVAAARCLTGPIDTGRGSGGKCPRMSDKPGW
jgi:AraC family transcriptional regulator of arabinose operon